MEQIERLFPRYDDQGKNIIYKAFQIAAQALKDQKRSNGAPFMEHPVAVASVSNDNNKATDDSAKMIFSKWCGRRQTPLSRAVRDGDEYRQ